MSNTIGAVIQVDFAKRQRLQSLGHGLYEIPGREGYYVRPVCKGRQREKKLKSRTERAARAELGKLLHDIARFEAGIGPDPFRDTAEKTLQDLCRFYLEQGCPKSRGGSGRTEQTLREEKRQVETIMAWPPAKTAAHLVTLEHCAQFRAWRVKKIQSSKGGDRQVDKEIVTLSNVFRCAMRAPSVTGVTANPIGRERPRFRNPQQIEHCRDHMPRSGADLHALARYFFSSGPRSEVLGWVTLIAAITGQRIHEVLRMRVDAKDKTEAGFLSGRRLYLFRSATSKGTYGHVDLTNDEIACLEAHRAWHTKRFPATLERRTPVWYFPSPEDPRQPLSDSALTHGLRRIGSVLNQPHVRAHGLRAFRVNLLRGRGLDDSEIALRIGQKTQGKLIVDVYGEGLDYKLEFMPELVRPAWSHFDGAVKEEQLQLL